MSKKLRFLFILFASIILSGCVQQEKGTEIPVYANSKSYSPPGIYYQLMGIPTEGVDVKVYYVEGAEVSEIINWYKDKLKDYVIAEEIPLVTISLPQGSAQWAGVLFQKGNKGVGIWAIGGIGVEGGKGVVYYLVTGPVDKLIIEEEKEELPPSDQASGEEPIPRYPGSVMLRYEKTEGYPLAGSYLSIDYGTKDEIGDVTDWYKNYLLGEGWSISKEESYANATYLKFSKEGKELYIDIRTPGDERNYTIIEIYYHPNELPESDQVSGEEPINRYPGSVMLEYYSMNLGEGRMIIITYGSRDDPDTIFNWYINYLQNNGWTVMSQSLDETLSVSAYKENKSVSIQISRNAYTEIEVQYTGV